MTMKKPLKTIISAASALTVYLATLTAHAAEEVNIYSYRQPFLIEPMLKDFEAQSGVKVNVVFAKKRSKDLIMTMKKPLKTIISAASHFDGSCSRRGQYLLLPTAVFNRTDA